MTLEVVNYVIVTHNNIMSLKDMWVYISESNIRLGIKQFSCVSCNRRMN